MFARSAQHDAVLREVDVTEDAGALRVVLQRRMRVRVIVRDHEGLPVFGAEVREEFQIGSPTTTDRSGAAVMWLSAGRQALHAHDPVTTLSSASQTLELVRGSASTELMFEIRRR